MEQGPGPTALTSVPDTVQVEDVVDAYVMGRPEEDAPYNGNATEFTTRLPIGS
jgi:hypothetical protein